MHRLKEFVRRDLWAQPFIIEVGLMFTTFVLAVLFALPGSTSRLYGYPFVDDLVISAAFLLLTIVEVLSLLFMDKGLRTTLAALQVAIFSFITYSSTTTISNGYGMAFAVPTIGALFVLIRLGDRNAV